MGLNIQFYFLVLLKGVIRHKYLVLSELVKLHFIEEVVFNTWQD